MQADSGLWVVRGICFGTFNHKKANNGRWVVLGIVFGFCIAIRKHVINKYCMLAKIFLASKLIAQASSNREEQICDQAGDDSVVLLLLGVNLWTGGNRQGNRNLCVPWLQISGGTGRFLLIIYTIRNGPASPGVGGVTGDAGVTGDGVRFSRWCLQLGHKGAADCMSHATACRSGAACPITCPMQLLVAAELLVPLQLLVPAELLVPIELLVQEELLVQATLLV